MPSCVTELTPLQRMWLYENQLTRGDSYEEKWNRAAGGSGSPPSPLAAIFRARPDPDSGDEPEATGEEGELDPPPLPARYSQQSREDIRVAARDGERGQDGNAVGEREGHHTPPSPPSPPYPDPNLHHQLLPPSFHHPDIHAPHQLHYPSSLPNQHLPPFNQQRPPSHPPHLAHPPMHHGSHSPYESDPNHSPQNGSPILSSAPHGERPPLSPPRSPPRDEHLEEEQRRQQQKRQKLQQQQMIQHHYHHGPRFPHYGDKLTWKQSLENLKVYRAHYGVCIVFFATSLCPVPLVRI